MKNSFLFFLVVLALFLAGCSSGGISGSGFGAASSFSGEKLGKLIGPGVEVTQETSMGSAISASLNGAAAGCIGLEPGKQYLLVKASSPATNYSVVVDDDKILCVVKEELQADQCQSDADCDDGLASTTDSCNGEPKVCLNTRATECKSGDSFCPPSCVKSIDSDCVRECFSDSECDDADPTTEDICGGVLLRCSHPPIFSEGQKVVACSTDDDCGSENFCRTGSCRESICIFENKPNGTVCNVREDKECFDSECISATEHPVSLDKVKIKWVNDGSSAGKVVASAFTNKLSTFEGHYGTDQVIMKEVFDFDCSSGTCIKRVGLEHSVEFTDLLLGKRYYYYLAGSGLSKLTVSKTATQSFLTCQSRCNDNDSCTVDSCDIETGNCVYEKDEQNPSC